MEREEIKVPGSSSTRRILLVLWVPSADREGRALPDQDEWKNKALKLFGETFGGATAMPRAEGVWRDDEAGGRLIRDFPILVHCYVTEDQLQERKLLTKLANFCRRMGRDTRQGEVALLIDGVFHSFTDFG